MIPGQLQSLANHLWQSTLFAAAAGLLTLALRNNRAQTRYRVWLAASVKFLIPFSLLVGVGSHWGRHAAPPIPPAGLSYVIEQVSQPFTAPARAKIIQTTAESSPVNWIPAVLCALWAIGSATIAFSWWRQWRDLRAALRTASPLDLPIGIKAMSSPAFAEPGVFGLRRPVLLLPAGITGHLTPPQLKAIVTHELCHVRRRDNLATAFHMSVEALFWFHPLVWWLGARLMEERERACDEEVLLMGNEPQEYAEGILRICELYLASPLPCVAGATGANLKKRVEQIMSSRAAQKLSGGRKLLLAGAGALAIAMPIVVGTMNAPVIRAQAPAQTTATTLKFEVASVKPDKSSEAPASNFPLGPGDVYVRNGGYFSASGFPLIAYISFAYKLNGNQLQYVLPQLPDWVKTERFDIQARAQGDPGKDQMRLMMRSLLADRFKLAIRYENREVPVFAFVLAKSGKTGPQLRPRLDTSPCPTEPQSSSAPVIVNGSPAFCNGIYPMPPSVPGRLRFGGRNVIIGFIADTFSAGTNLGRPMIDQTGLSGKFDFTLEWAQERRDPAAPGAAVQPDTSGPSFEEALREQLGIKLQPQKGAVSVLVVDHVEGPSEN